MAEEIFEIIFTGSGDNTSGIYEEYYPGLLMIILEILLPNILKEILSYYQVINIIHYDPLIAHGKFNKKTIKSIIRTIIENKGIIDPHIRSHTFYQTELDISSITEHHIIIDFAHILNYNTNTYKAIYIGWCDNYFANQKLINIDISTGNVKTYIDCLYESNCFNEHDCLYETDPVEKIKNIKQHIKLNLMEQWRNKKEKVATKENGGNFDEIFDSYNVLPEIMNKLWVGENQIQIYNPEKYTFYETFKESLNDKTIL